jgi:hypothetical protein
MENKIYDYMVERFWNDISEFELGYDIPNMIEMFGAGQNIHWVEDCVLTSLRTNGNVVPVCEVNSMIDRLNDLMIPYLVSVRREQRLENLFNPKEDTSDNFFDWLDEHENNNNEDGDNAKRH